MYWSLLSQQPKTVASNEGCHWDESAAQARAAGTFGNRPLVVLTAGREFIPPDPQGAKEANAFHETWVKELQPALARLSSRGRQVVVKNSGHGIQFEAPDAVVNAIRDVMKEIQ
jgi:pimeloyl-ACP methyl ester carboxylesterase